MLPHTVFPPEPLRACCEATMVTTVAIMMHKIATAVSQELNAQHNVYNMEELTLRQASVNSLYLIPPRSRKRISASTSFSSQTMWGNFEQNEHVPC